MLYSAMYFEKRAAVDYMKLSRAASNSFTSRLAAVGSRHNNPSAWAIQRLDHARDLIDNRNLAMPLAKDYLNKIHPFYKR